MQTSGPKAGTGAEHGKAVRRAGPGDGSHLLDGQLGVLPHEGLKGDGVPHRESLLAEDDPVAGVEKDGVPVFVGHHGVGLVIGVAGDPGLRMTEDLVVVKAIGTLPHPPLQLPLGGAQLEGLPGQGHQDQQHAVEQQQAAHQALVGVAIGPGHQADHAEQPAQGLGPPGLLLADGGLSQPVQGGQGRDVVGGLVDKGIQGFVLFVVHRLTSFFPGRKRKNALVPSGGLRAKNKFRGTT